MKTKRWREVLAERRTPAEIAALDRRVADAELHGDVVIAEPVVAAALP